MDPCPAACTGSHLPFHHHSYRKPDANLRRYSSWQKGKSNPRTKFSRLLLKTALAHAKVSEYSKCLCVFPQALEQLPAKFLQFAKPFLVLDKKPVIFERMVGIEMRPQHHVAQANWVG